MHGDHVECNDIVEWRRWLKKNHAVASGVWLVYPRKFAGHPGFSYDDMVDEAICWGWIDSRPGKVDQQFSKRFFSPRRPKSGWSAVNKERVARLTRAGRMKSAGLASARLAKENGAWNELDEVEQLVIPNDLRKELKSHPSALKNFNSFSNSNRRALLIWINSAKRPATRHKRILEVAEKAERNEVANQWKAKG